jgi:hypothetical protein
MAQIVSCLSNSSFIRRLWFHAEPMTEKYSFKYVVHVSLSGAEPAWTLHEHNTHLKKKKKFYQRSSAKQ